MNSEEIKKEVIAAILSDYAIQRSNLHQFIIAQDAHLIKLLQLLRKRKKAQKRKKSAKSRSSTSRKKDICERDELVPEVLTPEMFEADPVPEVDAVESHEGSNSH